MAPNKFIILSFICLLLTANYSKAQYADIGTGNLRNQLWWFNWNGFNIQEGASRTFTTADGLTVQFTFTGISGQILNPSVMDTWSGALLYNLYNFSNTAIQPALYALNTNAYNSKCTLKITATRNGIPVPFTLITADAEASDPNYENTTLTTSGTQWTTVDFFRNSTQTANPLTGCGTNTVMMTDTYSGTVGLGQIPVLATNATPGNTLNIGVNLQENASGGGGMGLAFGIIAAVDHGHLPASYGDAFHAINYTAINGCSYNPPFPTLVQNANIILGSTPPDPLVSDTVYLNNSDPDDDGVQTFPQYMGTGNYSVSVKLKNNSGNSAYLSSWFDYNNDGIFEANERL